MDSAEVDKLFSLFGSNRWQECKCVLGILSLLYMPLLQMKLKPYRKNKRRGEKGEKIKREIEQK